jgi:hypothetical protein
LGSGDEEIDFAFRPSRRHDPDQVQRVRLSPISPGSL